MAAIGMFGGVIYFTVPESIFWIESSFEIPDIQNQSVSNPISMGLLFLLVFLVVLQMIGSTAILAFMFAIPVVVLDKYRGTGYYETESE